jgi:hypothetical protein
VDSISASQISAPSSASNKPSIKITFNSISNVSTGLLSEVDSRSYLKELEGIDEETSEPIISLSENEN